MNRKTFYNDITEERYIDFLGDIRLVRRIYCKKHDLSQADMELLFKLHQLDIFTFQQFHSGETLYHWDKKRWARLREKDEWIKKKKHRDMVNSMYNTYELSKKAKTMMNTIYKHLCGELPLPTDERSNPLMKRKAYTDKVYSVAVKDFNEALRQKLRDKND